MSERHEVVLSAGDTLLLLFRDFPGISLELRHDMALETALDAALAKVRAARMKELMRSDEAGAAAQTNQRQLAMPPAALPRW